MKKLKVYLAGPDVFLPNAVAFGREAKSLVAACGFDPLFPLDNEISKDEANPSALIFKANAEMIRQADVVVANLNPFRGQEPDSGTVFEVGYAYGLGKRVIGYVESDDSMLCKIQAGGLASIGGDGWVDGDGLAIEDFGHPLNLMLMHSIEYLVIGKLKEAVDYLLRGEKQK